MKRLAAFAIVCLVLLSACANEKAAGPGPTKRQAKKWFGKGDWRNGLPLQPSASVNYMEFYRQYQANKNYWDEAFAFIKNQNLSSLAPGNYPIDGKNVYASVTENPTKDFDSTKWESHRNYIDLQYVISGKEKIGKASPSELTVIKPYDATKDVANYSGNGKLYEARPGTFFLFFPSDAHRPNIADGDNQPDKKLVIKIRYAD